MVPQTHFFLPLNAILFSTGIRIIRFSLLYDLSSCNEHWIYICQAISTSSSTAVHRSEFLYLMDHETKRRPVKQSLPNDKKWTRTVFGCPWVSRIENQHCGVTLQGEKWQKGAAYMHIRLRTQTHSWYNCSCPDSRDTLNGIRKKENLGASIDTHCYQTSLSPQKA